MQLKEIREEMKYSFREMAGALGLKPGTYQNYELNRRPVPAKTLEDAFLALQRDREWSKRYEPGGELDRIFEKVPYFMGEAERETVR